MGESRRTFAVLAIFSETKKRIHFTDPEESTANNKSYTLSKKGNAAAPAKNDREQQINKL